MEDNIRLPLALCLTPGNDNITMTNKVLKSLKPEFARNEKDRISRQNKFQKLLNSLESAKKYEGKEFPNFGPHPDFPIEQLMAVKVPAEVEDFCVKIIKGIEYKVEKRIIDSSFNINIYYCHDNAVENVIQLVKNKGEFFNPATGFEFYRSATPDKEKVLYYVTLLNKLKFFSSLLPKNFS
jgi:hypothetical protein